MLYTFCCNTATRKRKIAGMEEVTTIGRNNLAPDTRHHCHRLGRPALTSQTQRATDIREQFETLYFRPSAKAEENTRSAAM